METCAKCKTTVPTVNDAMTSGWIAYVARISVTGLFISEFGPLCRHCAESLNLQYNETTAEYEYHSDDTSLDETYDTRVEEN